MTPPVKVTVAIPFFDEERWLASSIRSVLAQSMRDFELLLVDDGSQDASLAIARGFDDPRITVLSDGERRGLPARLNEVARRARGELVARMDGDDVAHPQRLARQVELLDQHAEVAAVGTWAAVIDESESLVAIVESAALPASASDALERGLISHATMVARRDWLLRFPYDESLTRAEDRDLWCRTLDTTRFAVIGEPLYVVRVRAHDRSFLADYLESQRQNRLLYRRHGPRMIGPVRAARAWLGACGKTVVMSLATRAGFADRLVRRRGRSPTLAERELVLEALSSAEPVSAPTA